MKTEKEIINDIVALLNGSALASAVTGDVYRAGLRPRDSKKEDIIVSFLAGLPGQIESGVVIVSIYVADICPYNNGVYVEDGRRVEALETAAQQWVESISQGSSRYRFALDSTIASVEDENIKQHFISVRLKYQYF